MMHERRLLKHELRRCLDTLTGALLCTLLALTVTVIGQSIPHPLVLLVLLVPCIGLVARAWGIVASLLGLASSVFVFCTGLLPPIGSMEVASARGRTNLFWMVLCGGVSAYIFARPQSVNRNS